MNCTESHRAKPNNYSLHIALCDLCVFVVKLYLPVLATDNSYVGDFLPSNRCDDTLNCKAADTLEQSAANAPFQRHQPGQPPAKIVNSVALREFPASHFSGKSAQTAKFANLVQ